MRPDSPALVGEIAEALLARLYPKAPIAPRYPTPDFAVIHAELARKGVTRMLLWQEYKARHPEGCQYSAFCRDYEAWLGRQDAIMRFEHVPGDRLFVDYSGLTMDIVDRTSGEVRKAEVFVAAMGASNFTYVEGTLTQTLGDWLGAHVRALEYLGGVTAAIVPDNLKSGVRKPCRYEPDLNPSYHDFAEHYGMAILPARGCASRATRRRSRWPRASSAGSLHRCVTARSSVSPS